MPTRHINLTDHLDSFVDVAVGSGRYQNASEVVREGLRLLERQQQEDEQKLEALRAAVRVGEDAYARGEFVELAADEIGPYIAGLGRTARQRKRA
ncbi:type II toxin-antitoxin system ParD family antitoxin [Phenylobacterium sp.]|uniref:type II toxin-antitoxin system ParD family antitoxin n=1 Tax=Phenylobacterium sp. TaxID=1871053 RepID=UPI0008B72C3A|nr:MAG: addiction module antidote protein [Phenylobacterium sp. RIFCSPHIGHO2_01_FULL_70_10]